MRDFATAGKFSTLLVNLARVFATAGKFTTVSLVASEVRVVSHLSSRLLVAIEVRVFATAGKFTTVLLVAIEVRDFATAGKFTTVLLVASNKCVNFATAGEVHDCIACSDRSA